MAMALAGCAPKTLHVPGQSHPGDVWLQPSGGPDGLGAVGSGPEPPLRLLWRQDAGKPPVGGPLLDGRLLLQLTGASRVVAYDLTSGARVGRRSFAEDWCAPLSVAGPGGELLIASLAGDKPEVRAFDRVAGGWRWRLPLASCAAPAVRGDTLVIATESGAVAAVRATSGAELWRWTGKGLFAVPPAWEGQRICVGDVDGRVSLLDGGSGLLQWQRDLEAGVRGRPALEADAAYLVTAGSDVVCLDAGTGTVRWRTHVGGLLSGASVGARVLVVGSSDFGVYGLDRSSGAILWRYDTGGVVRGAPVVAGPTVYATGGGAALVAVEASTGRLLWEWPLDGPAAAPVAVGATLVALTTERGTVYLFGREDAHGGS